MKHKRYVLLLVTLILALALASAALAADMNQDTKPPVEGTTTTLEDSGTVTDKGEPEIPGLPTTDTPGLNVVSAYTWSQNSVPYSNTGG
jgi:hypothetical protein